jgi:hypothetical protein
MAFTGAGNVHVSQMVSSQLRALVCGAGKGVVLAPLRDGGPGGVTFSHLPGEITARTNTEEGTRAFITIFSAFLSAILKPAFS